MKRDEIIEGVAETVPMRTAQKVLNHYGADYFGTTYDTLYFYKNRKQFSIGRIRDDDIASAGSVSLSELNAMVRKLRGMSSSSLPYKEGVAGPKNCWPGYRKTGTQPGTGKNKGKRVNDCEKIGEELDESPDVPYQVKAGPQPMAMTTPKPTAIVASNKWTAITPEIEAKATQQGFRKVMLKVNNQLVPGLEGGDQALGSKIIVAPTDFQTMTGTGDAGTMRRPMGVTSAEKTGIGAPPMPTKEAHYRAKGSQSAYDRDYRSSVSGMGRPERDMSDEANLLYIYKDGKLRQKMISNHNEREARQMGFRDTPEQALKLHGIIRSKFDPKKFVQNVGGKWVPVNPYGESESVAESKKEAPKPRNFVAKNAKMGGAGQHKDKKKAQKQGDVKHKKALAEEEIKQANIKTITPQGGVEIVSKDPNDPIKSQTVDQKFLIKDPKTGSLMLNKTAMTATGPGQTGAEENPIKPGAPVSVVSAEDVHAIDAHQGAHGDEETAINTHSPIDGDQQHDEITKLLVSKLRQLAGL